MPADNWEILLGVHIGPACAAAFPGITVQTPQDSDATYKEALSETISLLASRVTPAAGGAMMAVALSRKPPAARPKAKSKKPKQRKIAKKKRAKTKPPKRRKR